MSFFLSLPYTFHREVMPLLDPHQVVHWAIDEPYFRYILSLVKIPAEKLTWNFKERFYISIEFDGLDPIKFYIPDWLPRYRKTKKTEAIDTWSLKFEIVKHKPVTRRNPFYENVAMPTRESIPPGTTKMELMEAVTNYLREMLRIKKYSVSSYHSKSINFFNCFIWKVAGKFASVEFTSPKSLELGRASEELKMLQEKQEIEKLVVHFRNTKNQRGYTSPLKRKFVTIEDSEFIQLDSLLYSESSQVTVLRSEFNGIDVNAIIKQWMNGGLNNLEMLRLKLNKMTFADEVFNDIEVVPT
ncbi:hypothetical protein GCK72_024023 [Caenorhabditis remanei]|uniref:Sdz-33 F-box domain-containing protein n=1 Tax=Caenorhabditis remanei TaxID=31234 RepID=A0A6A5FY12_CAERE|nr:hypothetical protein GCK72_024023 [Caenorhabditis remanei]KAF1747558.1 hypothetical protein GCK72_024023 [Caenorhabditis remanei]